MNRKEVVFLAAALVVILIFGGASYRMLAQRGTPAAPETPETGQGTSEHTAAPDFLVYDARGEEVRLSDFARTPVVINFWATWCPPCRGELPEFQKAYETYGDRIRFLMVDLTGGSETQEGAEAFLAENGYTFPVYYDLDASAAGAYGIYSIPVTVTVDAQGKMADSRVGALTGEQLTGMLDTLLGEGGEG